MTTQWQSIFDTSSTSKCLVAVYDNVGPNAEDGTVVWSGDLGKGDTSPSFKANDNNDYTVAVDASGVVTLDSVGGSSFGMAVEVGPGDLAAGTRSRIIDISVGDGGGGGSHPGFAYCWPYDNAAATIVPVDFSTDPATPTEADFDVMGWLGVQVESVG